MHNDIIKSVRLRINQIQVLGVHDVLLFSSRPFHSDILGNEWQERLHEPLHEDLVWNLGLDHPTSSSPLMYMIRNVSGNILIQRCQELCSYLIPYRKLVMHKKCHSQVIETI